MMPWRTSSEVFHHLNKRPKCLLWKLKDCFSQKIYPSRLSIPLLHPELRSIYLCLLSMSASLMNRRSEQFFPTTFGIKPLPPTFPISPTLESQKAICQRLD